MHDAMLAKLGRGKKQGSKLRCPKCHEDTVVIIDSRPSGDTIRRRRACVKCYARWTTYELEESQIRKMVADKISCILSPLRSALKSMDELEPTDDTN